MFGSLSDMHQMVRNLKNKESKSKKQIDVKVVNSVISFSHRQTIAIFLQKPEIHCSRSAVR